MRESRAPDISLAILATVAAGAALYWLRGVMIPFVLALFISFGLSWVIDLQRERLRFPRWLALISTLAIGLVMLAGLASLVSASVGQLTAQAPLYTEHLQELVDRLVQVLPAGMLTRAEAERALGDIPVSTVGGVIKQTANAILAVLSQSVVVTIFVIFLLLGGRQQRRATGFLGEAETRIQRYIVTKVVISGTTGLLVGLVLSLLGVPLAMVFGLFAFLLNFIPSIGSIVATLLPLPIVAVSPEISPTTALLAISIPAVIQISIGNVIEPKVMGDSMDLHPIVILLSLILWGTLWGIVGMILAVPLMAAVKIVCERSPTSRPVAELMAGRLDALGA